MKAKKHNRPNIERILSSLKDFQRNTVQYVFQRLFQDPDPTSRFLIADEVGLGKTLVARGVIAKVVDHLWDDVERIDVVYICTNQEIAQQNIDRLNITQNRTFQHASRATLLPITIQELKDNKLNFVSLTPGTSFNLRSQKGWSWERVVLYFLLKKAWNVPPSTLGNILRGDVRKDRWREKIDWFRKNERIDRDLAASFIQSLKRQPECFNQYRRLAKEIGSRRTNLDREIRRERDTWIGNLRRVLAQSSLSALQPDLIILDEFQRFKYLLEEENEIAMLARELFNFKDPSGRPAKVLLLSATPYKMYTLQTEEENHYDDFFQTIKFLLAGEGTHLEKLKDNVDQYRSAFLHWTGSSDDRRRLMDAKQGIESVLRKVMVRTERLAASADRNGMLIERTASQDQLDPKDLVAFAHLDRISQFLDADSQMEYWKSSAYSLSFMEGYKLKRQLERVLSSSDHDDLIPLLQNSREHLLHWKDVQTYQPIDPANARLRSLVQETVDSGNWKLLWVPANLPYYAPEGPFAEVAEVGITKSLIFSSWQIVPKMIAMFLSYEAERRVMELDERDFSYDELLRKRSPLLRFAHNKGRQTGLSIFTLIYPCLTLATIFDPLDLALQSWDGELSSNFYMIQKVKAKLRSMVEQATESMPINQSGPEDERWYWYAPILLDRHFHYEEINEWFSCSDPSFAWEKMLQTDPEEREDGSAFAEHIQGIKAVFKNVPKLGRVPDDLLDLLATIAVAGPAVSTLRSMLRVTRVETCGPEILAAAAQTGLGFRTLFNQPDAIFLLQSLYKEQPERERVYWRSILNYCLQGNLQAVMDEYVHILRESLGLVDHSPREIASKLGESLRKALSLRSPSLRFDEIELGKTNGLHLSEHSIRCRYALRFGHEKAQQTEDATRDTDVRIAFNSPFRPFVLATTSIGQEGLDFHQYCHKIIHWNLPANPVDLEQREGRIHRYKGHVIRRNLTYSFSLGALKPSTTKNLDPWEALFLLAQKSRRMDSDLEPFWVFDKGPQRIERIIPMLPLSREARRLKDLKDTLVAYRSVIGQPRQQELMETLRQRLSMENLEKISLDYSIDLNPPKP